MNEFDCLKECLPLQQNLQKYLCIKTKINYFDDSEFCLNTSLDKTVRKFAHTGWTEMRPIVVGIKCYLSEPEEKGTVDVCFTNKSNEKRTYIDTFSVNTEEWHTFKYPLLEAYHTDTRIMLSQNVSAFTLAILNCSTYVREKHFTNYYPAEYNSYDTPLSATNYAIVYLDDTRVEINPNAGKDLPKYLIGPI
jgi:hypothetical protein